MAHYYVILPYAQAVLLANSRDRRLLAACVVGFALSTALSLATPRSEVARLVLDAGALPLSGLVALLGLWALRPEPQSTVPPSL
jgi:hypothetical protein